MIKNSPRGNMELDVDVLDVAKKLVKHVVHLTPIGPKAIFRPFLKFG
jgi:hypothetical protein